MVYILILFIYKDRFFVLFNKNISRYFNRIFEYQKDRFILENIMSRRSSSSNPKQVISSDLIIFLIFIIQNFQVENESLRQEISALKKILSIPIDENHRYTHFRYQIYSLEKQIALLTRLLDAKREAVATCETILIELNQFLQ
jgi:dynactin complex subunit